MYVFFVRRLDSVGAIGFDSLFLLQCWKRWNMSEALTSSLNYRGFLLPGLREQRRPARGGRCLPPERVQ